jgi:hypothetical protein
MSEPIWYDVSFPNRSFDVVVWYILLRYSVHSVWFKWALQRPQLSGCLLQRHGEILVLM